MGATRIDLARQAVARLFSFGTNTAGGEGVVTIEKGNQPTSFVGLDVKASASIGGDLNLGGNLNLVGSINEQAVTNLLVADKTITTNRGGAAGSASGAGVETEAGGAVVAALRVDTTKASRWTVGDGTTQSEVADVSSAQTLTNKTLTSPTLTGTPTAPTPAAGTNSTQVATTAYVQAALGGASTAYFHATPVTGTQDGSNKTLAIGNGVTAGSEQIFLNGQLLTPGAANDYVLAGTVLTIQAAMAAPVATDVIRAYGVFG